MEDVGFSKALVRIYQITRRHIPRDSDLRLFHDIVWLDSATQK
jgi:hypothetical protein